VSSARQVNAEMSKHETMKAYKDLGAQLEKLGTDLQVMVQQIRGLQQDPIVSDPKLKTDADRIATLDHLTDVLVRLLREADRMPDPLSTLSMP
jgi:hypothetical protein